MAAWLLILVEAAALVVVGAVVALAWVISGRAKPGGLIDPNKNPGVQAVHGHFERTNIQHYFGAIGPGI